MGIQSVERTFAVVGVLAGADPEEIPVAGIAEATDLPKSTVSRILSTLGDLGVAIAGESGGSYRLGPGARVFAGRDPVEAELVRTAHPVLVRAVEFLDEDLGLAVSDGDHVRYVDQVRSQRAVRIRVYVGERTPLHTTAAGLVALADLADDNLAAYLAGPLASWGRGTSVDPAELGTTVESVRTHGVAWTSEAWADGVNGAAVPVRDPDGGLVAILNAFGPSYRFPDERGRAETARCLVDTANEIARLL
ncbi:MAG: IclR family transcriptional regulator [Actinomycetota bacterium]|nr:IclR family transcriptional regulator [Actinomycetota bacterium]MEC9395522.1 IclR family transcriptional regulator [Actinomycetota bacterium]MED6328788.1 IclR family transcriptional regulator [Actinomycetota bacterium]MEE2957803.1 IclR family transcriptional regulator [Actinomycetota bacterium]